MIPPYKGPALNNSVNMRLEIKKISFIRLGLRFSSKAIYQKKTQKTSEMIKRYGEITGDDLGEVEELILE